jgi:outer membrane protein OmpA-like peptidoglycan-associated protein
MCVLTLGCALSVAGLGAAQSGTPDGVAQPPQTLPAPSANTDKSADSTYATGKPLAGQSKEGFWGKVNPFARKKWVNRQVDPIKDRTNELDQLQAKNANDIRDVDARSQAGINKALASASAADRHAADAQGRADAAQSVATDASNRTSSLGSTVSSLDQYQTVTALPVTFAAGRTTLGPRGKAEIDEVAGKLNDEKGYIIEVQGYSPAGVRASQAMADSVVRYLVVEHHVPIYRIYRTGLGKGTEKTAEGGKPLSNGVIVSLMHNSLATMGTTSAAAAPTKATPGASSMTGVSNPNSN